MKVGGAAAAAGRSSPGRLWLVLGKGPQESSIGTALGLPQSRLRFQKQDQISQKIGKEGRNCTSLCPHSVSPLLHAVTLSYNIPTGP